jgi:hypothetical protein
MDGPSVIQYVNCNATGKTESEVRGDLFAAATTNNNFSSCGRDEAPEQSGTSRFGISAQHHFLENPFPSAEQPSSVVALQFALPMSNR